MTHFPPTPRALPFEEGSAGPEPSGAASSPVPARAPVPPVAVTLMLVLVSLLSAPALAGGHGLGAQIVIQDLVFTGGVSSEGYQGNLPTVGAAVRDSTEFAAAVVGEFGARGVLTRPLGEQGRGRLAFDGGLRQFSARGFELRDYSPRELSGTLDLSYLRPMTTSVVGAARLRVRGRDVADRPPMPLFLQPGYRSVGGSLSGEWLRESGPRWDLEFNSELSRFLAPAFAPQIRLLDRRQGGVELGVRPGWEVGGDLRFHLGAEITAYPRQETFLEEDPSRLDRALQGGATWTWSGPVLVQVVGEARANRSNSRRPEYDSATLRALISTSLPADVAMTGYVALTGKRYRFPTEFARLIPGEEANSASQAFLAFSRPLARNLDSNLRLGWTRAETEIGGQYFQRFGATLLLNYRP